MARGGRDDLIDLACDTGGCLDLTKNTIACFLQDLRSKTVRHARLRRENRFRIEECRHWLTEAYRTAEITLVQMRMVRGRIRKGSGNGQVRVAFDHGSQMRRELGQ